MKTKKIATILVAACSVFLSSISFAGPTMQLKHKNVPCETCHGTNNPVKPANQAACIQCHGQYKGKVIPGADYNPNRNPRRPELMVNPHDSHLGDVRCTLCHREHFKSPQTTCNQCHSSFKLNTK